MNDSATPLIRIARRMSARAFIDIISELLGVDDGQMPDVLTSEQEAMLERFARLFVPLRAELASRCNNDWEVAANQARGFLARTGEFPRLTRADEDLFNLDVRTTDELTNAVVAPLQWYRNVTWLRPDEYSRTSEYLIVVDRIHVVRRPALVLARLRSVDVDLGVIAMTLNGARVDDVCPGDDVA